jgi:hypothetical protein
MAAGESRISQRDATALKRLAGRYNTRMAEADDLRLQLDELVAIAKESGGTFREIAALADRSVAWVQGSLERSKSAKS